MEMHDLPAAPALRLPQAEAAGPSSLLRYRQDHVAASAQLRGPRQAAQKASLFGLPITSGT